MATKINIIHLVWLLRSLETYSRTSGLHTVSVSGLLSLRVSQTLPLINHSLAFSLSLFLFQDTDRLVLQVSTGSATTATILTHSSFMGFLWGRSRSSQ